MRHAPESTATIVWLTPAAARGDHRRACARRAMTSPADGGAPPSVPSAPGDRERALLDAWRDAHWSLQMEVQEAARRCPHLALDEAYDDARRCDNLLNALYRDRADVLARELRDAREELSRAMACLPDASPRAAAERAPAVDQAAVMAASMTERALLARFEQLSPDDRALLMRLATQLGAARRVLPARG